MRNDGTCVRTSSYIAVRVLNDGTCVRTSSDIAVRAL